MGSVTISRRDLGAVLAMGLAFLTVAGASGQTLFGLWGSPLYRVQLVVSGSSVTGTFTPAADPKAPPGNIVGQVQKDGRGFTAQWTLPLGSDTSSFSTWLSFAVPIENS